MRNYIPLLSLVFLAACNPADRNLESTTNLTGYAPVYLTAAAAETISTGAPQPTKKPGKIYAYGDYLFQVEEAQGIHIIDNSVSKAAKKIAFLSVPMASEIAIRANHLYTNNVNDLVVFSLANPAAPQLLKRVANAFPAINQTHPPFTNVYFECPDATKGLVVGWEQKTLTTAKCRR